MINLIVKYNVKYIVKKDIFGVDYIVLKNNGSIMGTISLYIMYLIYGLLDNDDVYLDYVTGLEMSENTFDSSYIVPINSNTYMYDVDLMMKEYETYYDIKLPNNTKCLSREEIINISKTECYFEDYTSNNVSDELLSFFNSNIEMKKNSEKLYLMFSAGKDSTLSALRLSKDYDVYLYHFDNGYMKDGDKPYITYYFSDALRENPNINFSVINSFSVGKIFNRNFEIWKELHGDNLSDKSIDSEIRCLCCRCAMYEKLLSFCILDDVKNIGDGARICQKFMLEQIPMIERFSELASRYGIETHFPVLYEDDDSKVKDELISNGLSSKSWESKCLLGREAMDKSEDDCNIILKYYDDVILPMMINNLDEIYSSHKSNVFTKEP